MGGGHRGLPIGFVRKWCHSFRTTASTSQDPEFGRYHHPATPIKRAPRFRRTTSFAIAGLLTVSAIISGWEGVSLWQAHNDGVDARALEANHTAFEIADTLGATIHAVEEDMSVNTASAAEAILAHRSDSEAMLTRFADSLARFRQISFFVMFNPSGDLLASTDNSLKRQRVTARGRDFFRYFSESGTGYFVTASYLTGPEIERKPVMLILVSQALKAPDGTFAGVLVAAMAPNRILRSQIDPTLYFGKNVRLFLDTGKLLSLQPEDNDLIGKSFTTHSLFSKIAPLALPQWGVLPNPFEDTPEIAALHKTSELPFLISVSTTNGPDLRGWWHRIAVLLIYAGTSFLVVLIFLLKGLWVHDDPAPISSDSRESD
jgi:hypothetical protein